MAEYNNNKSFNKGAYKKSFGFKVPEETLYKHPSLPLLYSEKGRLSKVLSDTSKSTMYAADTSQFDTTQVSKNAFTPIKKSNGQTSDDSFIQGIGKLYDLIGVRAGLSKSGLDLDVGKKGHVKFPFGNNWDAKLWYKRNDPNMYIPSTNYSFGVKIRKHI